MKKTLSSALEQLTHHPINLFIWNKDVKSLIFKRKIKLLIIGGGGSWGCASDIEGTSTKEAAAEAERQYRQARKYQQEASLVLSNYNNSQINSCLHFLLISNNNMFSLVMFEDCKFSETFLFHKT